MFYFFPWKSVYANGIEIKKRKIVITSDEKFSNLNCNVINKKITLIGFSLTSKKYQYIKIDVRVLSLHLCYKRPLKCLERVVNRLKVNF